MQVLCLKLGKCLYVFFLLVATRSLFWCNSNYSFAWKETCTRIDLNQDGMEGYRMRVVVRQSCILDILVKSRGHAIMLLWFGKNLDYQFSVVLSYWTWIGYLICSLRCHIVRHLLRSRSSQSFFSSLNFFLRIFSSCQHRCLSRFSWRKCSSIFLALASSSKIDWRYPVNVEAPVFVNIRASWPWNLEVSIHAFEIVFLLKLLVFMISLSWCS